MFGSGRSTLALLKAGFHVVTLEDSQFWLDKSVSQIDPVDLPRHVGLVKPLSLKLLSAFPVLDWLIDNDLKMLLAFFCLVLVDLPHFTPFGGSTLLSSPFYAPGALVFLDGTLIPVLR